MKRYDLIHYCPYPGGGESELEEAEDGDWVKHEEAQSDIEGLRAENERLITLIADIRRHVSECPDGVGRFIHERMQDFEQLPNA